MSILVSSTISVTLSVLVSNTSLSRESIIVCKENYCTTSKIERSSNPRKNVYQPTP